MTHLGGTRKFWYDANGNEITRTVGAVTYTQTWDAENRLVSVTQGGVTTAFTYNGDGARVRVSVNGVITTYVGTTYETVTTTGVTTYYYLGSQRVAMRTATGVTYLAGDHLGSASLATNSAGAKVSDERYYPYGGTRSGSMPTDYQFTGQKRDTGTGLYYYGARYYDAVTGRFLSPDTIVPSPGNPQSLNRYAYVRNNPLRFVDPSGHMELCNYETECGWSAAGDPEERRALLSQYAKHLQPSKSGDAQEPVYASAALTSFAAHIGSDSSDAFVSDLNCVVLGYCSGPDWMVLLIGVDAPRFGGGRWWMGQNAFPGRGEWRDRYYDDTANQLYHFWFYVGVSYFDGLPVAVYGNAYHDPEFRNPISPAFGTPPAVTGFWAQAGTSVQDYDLGVAGSVLGLLLRLGYVKPHEVPSWIALNLGRLPASGGE